MLCALYGVSRSGFYRWCDAIESRRQCEERDRNDFLLIVAAYKFRGYDKGVRGIYMRLLRMGCRMNPKKIRRLMRKYGLWCRIREANPYRRMAKALRTNAVADNLLKREFRQHGPRTVLLTDITYIRHGNDDFYYLSVIKDAFTMEILSHVLSDSLAIDLVLLTVQQLVNRYGDQFSPEVMVHSDQGCHYTSVPYRRLLKDKGLRQSMSRRGNCWDNAPQESFFGHMKDRSAPGLPGGTT